MGSSFISIGDSVSVAAAGVANGSACCDLVTGGWFTGLVFVVGRGGVDLHAYGAWGVDSGCWGYEDIMDFEDACFHDNKTYQNRQARRGAVDASLTKDNGDEDEDEDEDDGEEGVELVGWGDALLWLLSFF